MGEQVFSCPASNSVRGVGARKSLVTPRPPPQAVVFLLFSSVSFRLPLAAQSRR